MANNSSISKVTMDTAIITTNLPMDNSTNATTVPISNDSQAKFMNITLMTIGAATVLMNIFVITIILVFKWMRSNANIIIGSMAVTDLLMGFITITSGAIKWTNWFSIRGIFCQIFFTVDGWGTMASLAHVLAVNGDRYLAIVFPLKYKNITSPTRTRIILLLLWIITIIEASVYTFAYELGENCRLLGMGIPSLAFGIFIVSVVVPFLTVVGLYIHIVIVIIRKLRFMAKTSNIEQSALVHSQRKMFGIVSAILAAWIICWFPMMCVILAMIGAEALNMYLDASQFVDMLYYTEAMAYGNSLLNPILYFLLSRDFRKAGLLLFKCKSQETNESTPAVTATTGTEDTHM